MRGIDRCQVHQKVRLADSKMGCELSVWDFAQTWALDEVNSFLGAGWSEELFNLG
jgi:hypothetical protein